MPPTLSRRDKLLNGVFGTVVGRTIGMVVNVFVGGGLTNWLITDLSVGGAGVDWTRLDDTPATWWSLGFVVTFLTYTGMSVWFERRYHRWNDNDYLLAVLRERLFPILLENAERKIREGGLTSLDTLEREILRNG